MEEIRFAVTSNKNDNRELIEQAKAWARQLRVPYVKRYDNGSLDAMLADHHLDALLMHAAVSSGVGQGALAACRAA